MFNFFKKKNKSKKEETKQEVKTTKDMKQTDEFSYFPFPKEVTFLPESYTDKEAKVSIPREVFLLNQPVYAKTLKEEVRNGQSEKLEDLEEHHFETKMMFRSHITYMFDDETYENFVKNELVYDTKIHEEQKEENKTFRPITFNVTTEQPFKIMGDRYVNKEVLAVILRSNFPNSDEETLKEILLKAIPIAKEL